MNGTDPPRLSPAALISFLLGLASFALCLLGVSGIPALFIGWRGLRSVNASEGRLTGARLAIAGMVLGGLGTLATLGGILAIILIQVQQSAARTTCQDNLRRIGVSLNQYADTRKTFPAAVVGPAGFRPDQQLSWMSEMLPLLGDAQGGLGSKRLEERTKKRYVAVLELIDQSRAWDDPVNALAVDTVLRVYRCPMSPGYDPNQGPGLTNYVGLSGIGLDAAELPRTDRQAGLFGYDRGVKREELAGGISRTIAVLETAEDLGPWLAGGRPTVRGLAKDMEQYGGVGKPFGGMHPGMMNVLFVDGHVEAFKDTTNGEVLRRLATLWREP